MRRRITHADLPNAVPPGQMLFDELEFRGISAKDAANAITEGSVEDLDRLIVGELELTPAIAGRLYDFLGTKAYLWVKVEASYRAALAAGKPLLVTSRFLVSQEKLPSGKLVLRMPVSLHARLSDYASDEGISLNQLILSYIAEGLGRSEKTLEGRPQPAVVREKRRKYKAD